MSEWRTIDSAPKDGTAVLLYLKEKADRRYVVDDACPKYCIGFYGHPNEDYAPGLGWVSIEVEDMGSMGGEYTGWMPDWCAVTVYPTHWMPLPEPPK